MIMTIVLEYRQYISKIDIAVGVEGIHRKRVFLGPSLPTADLHLDWLHFHQLVEPQSVALHVDGGPERVRKTVVGQRYDGICLDKKSN